MSLLLCFIVPRICIKNKRAWKEGVLFTPRSLTWTFFHLLFTIAANNAGAYIVFVIFASHAFWMLVVNFTARRNVPSCMSLDYRFLWLLLLYRIFMNLFLLGPHPAFIGIINCEVGLESFPPLSFRLKKMSLYEFHEINLSTRGQNIYSFLISKDSNGLLVRKSPSILQGNIVN